MAEPSHAFLLRCWQEPDGDGELAWRFSLTYINEKREKRGFANLEAVTTYLQKMLAAFDRGVSGGKQPGGRPSS
ncbi:MAG: hypothetical protein P8074_13600 [Anaerolineales bacterium]|jgi:hypothetical protein